MNKLFVWNSEYEYYICITENVEKARELFIKENNKNTEISEENHKLWSKIVSKLPRIGSEEYYNFIKTDDDYKQYSKINKENRAYSNEEDSWKIYRTVIDNPPSFIFNIQDDFSYIMKHSNE